MEDDLTCSLNFTGKNPALVIEFPPTLLTIEEIKSLSAVLEKTATKWLSCNKCGIDACQEGVRDDPRSFKVVH